MTTGMIPRLYLNAKLMELPSALQKELTDEVYARWDARRRRGPGVLLMGNNGVGKTHAASALANDIYASGFSVRPPVYIPSTALIDLWKEYDHFREQAWSDTIFGAPLLIIDDLGKELGDTDTQKARGVSRVGSTLRTRVQRGLATFITTNLNEKGLAKEYGASIVSLLHEVAPLWLEVGGKDRRKAKA